MPKRKPGMTAAEQSAEFERFAREQIDAGELNPTEADEVLDKLVRRQASLGGGDKS